MKRHNIKRIDVIRSRCCIHFFSSCGIRCLDIEEKILDVEKKTCNVYSIFRNNHEDIFVCTVTDDYREHKDVHYLNCVTSKTNGFLCDVCKESYLDSRELVILDSVLKLNGLSGVEKYLCSLRLSIQE